MGSALAWTKAENDAYSVAEAQAVGLLKLRREKAKIPVVRFETMGDEILIHRLPQRERRTAGGLWLPTFSLDKKNDYSDDTTSNENVTDVGLLLDAGLGARDWLRTHGGFVGDYVRFGHYAGREQASHHFDIIHEFEGDPKDLLQLNVKDIRGSFDLHWRLNGGKPVDVDQEMKPVLRLVWFSDEAGNGIHVLRPIVTKE